MQVNELRIGNKIQDGNGFIFDVVSIFEDGTIYCDFKDNEGDVWEFDKNNHCYGIPLTEEILLKCEGIIKHPTIKNRYLFEDKKSSFHISDWDNPSLDIFIDGKYIICVEFLHTFQNLIYVLTDQELNIEL